MYNLLLINKIDIDSAFVLCRCYYWLMLILVKSEVNQSLLEKQWVCSDVQFVYRGRGIKT